MADPIKQKTIRDQDSESSSGYIIIDSGSENYRLSPKAQSVVLEKWIGGCGWEFEDDISHETAKRLEKDADVYVKSTRSPFTVAGLEPDEVNNLLTDYRDIAKALRRKGGFGILAAPEESRRHSKCEASHGYNAGRMR